MSTIRIRASHSEALPNEDSDSGEALLVTVHNRHNRNSEQRSSDLDHESTDGELKGSASIDKKAVVGPVLVSLLAVALALCNADRVIMSMAIMPLSAANGWPPSVAGVVQSAFLWGYALTPLIGGAIADRFGGRPVLAVGIALWSAATLLTPLAASRSFSALLLVRAAMGLGEGVALPCMTSMLSAWMPETQRARATAICFLGFHLGSMIGLLSAPPLMSAFPSLGVTTPFFFFGIMGFLWLAAWIILIPSTPPPSPVSLAVDLASNGAVKVPRAVHPTTIRPLSDLPVPLFVPEVADGVVTTVGTPRSAVGSVGGDGDKSGRPVMWRLMTHPATWAIFVASMANNFGYFIMLSWMPLYFNKVLLVNLSGAAWFTAAPWAVMAAAGILAGNLADWLLQSPPPPETDKKSRPMLGRIIHRPVSKIAVRKLMQSVGFLGPSLGLAALAAARKAEVASLLLTVVLACSAFSQAGFLLNHKDIAPRYAAMLHGIAQTFGTLAGIWSTIGTGYAVELLGSFHAVLLVTSGIYLLGWIFWMVFSTASVVFP